MHTYIHTYIHTYTNTYICHCTELFALFFFLAEHRPPDALELRIRALKAKLVPPERRGYGRLLTGIVFFLSA